MKLKNAVSFGSFYWNRSGVCRYIFIGFLLSNSGYSFGDYKDDIGYTQLTAELGAGLPDGSGVNVSLVEADLEKDTPDVIAVYSPNPYDPQFQSPNKTITDLTGRTRDLSYSGHAATVGGYFFGNTNSTAPGITNIESYNAIDWLTSGFLDAGQSGLDPKSQPLSTSSRIANHSWVVTFGSTGNSEVLRRIDWVVERDEFMQVIATNNGSTPQALLSGAYNAIAVGRTDGVHATGTIAVDGDYTANRTRPDIVAPSSATSYATPMVASATALLVETGHNNPGLSTSAPAINRNRDTIYSAERSEVIKAALMAGAERVTSNTTAADISDYRAEIANQTSNGLDLRFGAGQLSVFNSYHIIAAGEQNSIDDDLSLSGGHIGNRGFDYDPSFGGNNGSNAEASYFFSTGVEYARLAASLVWNINIEGGSSADFNGAATLFDMDLFLYDITGATDVVDWIKLGSSESLWENSENLWMMLDGNRNYAMQVKTGIGQAAFEWDYALAWQVTPVPIPVAFWLFGSGLLGLIGFGGRGKSISQICRRSNKVE